MGTIKEKIVNFKPFNKHILIEAPIISEVTEAGIVKPDSLIKEEKKNQKFFLKVVAVADDVEGIDPEDEVFLGSGNLKIIPIEGKDYALVHVLSVIGKKLY